MAQSSKKPTIKTKKPAAKKVAAKPLARSKNTVAPSSTLMSSLGISFRQATGSLLVLSMVLLGISGWFWWYAIVLNPDRALDDMLERSLQTASVVREVSQNDQQGQVQQLVRLDLSAKPAVQTVTQLQQPGQAGPTSVTTETIGTPQQDYIRYKAIDAGTTLKADALHKVVGLWGARETGANGRSFFNEAVIGLVPFGNLKSQDRKALLGIMQSKQVYQYTKVTQKSEHGRPVFVYELSIAPGDLIEALASYARATGFGDATQLDPDEYAGMPPVKMNITIDALSRQLTSIEYTDSGRLERYHGTGLKAAVPRPAQTIPLADLQQRLQSSQPASR